jgi:hypothetical protein
MSQSMLVRTSRHATCRRVHAPAHTPCYPFILARPMGMLLKYRHKLDASRLNQRILNRLRSSKIAMLSHNPRNTCVEVTLLRRHIRAQPRIKDLLRTPLPASAFSKVNLLFLQKPPVSVGNEKKHENVRPSVLRKLTLRLCHATIRVRPQK